MLTRFGQLLEVVREQAKLGKLEFAQALGVGHAWLFQISTGHRPPPQDFIGKVVRTFRVPPIAEAELVEASADICKVVQLRLANFDPARRRLAMKFARNLLTLRDEDIAEMMQLLEPKPAEEEETGEECDLKRASGQ